MKHNHNDDEIINAVLNFENDLHPTSVAFIVFVHPTETPGLSCVRSIRRLQSIDENLADQISEMIVNSINNQGIAH